MHNARIVDDIFLVIQILDVLNIRGARMHTLLRFKILNFS